MYSQHMNVPSFILTSSQWPQIRSQWIAFAMPFSNEGNTSSLANVAIGPFWSLYTTGCRSCQREDGMDDMKKGTQLLEVYALEIQMHTELKNNKQLKALYKRALDVKSAIPHPRIMGIIRECGGKMHMHERAWSDAATDFFEVRWKQTHRNAYFGSSPWSLQEVRSEFCISLHGLVYICLWKPYTCMTCLQHTIKHMIARKIVDNLLELQAFKSYDEAGAMRRVQCLKYLVLANMLMESSVDPFDAQEAKPYKNDNQVLAMTDLVQAYQRNDISAFERILKTNK